MAYPRLRIYLEPEQPGSVETAQAVESETVTVPLGEVLEALADAVRQGRVFLRDFEDEEITLSSDLYEVLTAYDHFHRPA